MRRRVFESAVAVAILAVCSVGALGWEADFEPSTYNPRIGEPVEFAICEPCLGSGTFAYAWDFDGDGAVDLDTTEPTAKYTYDADGYYEARVTLKDADGRRKSARKGILVGEVPAYGVRETIDQGDGTIFVLVTVYANDAVLITGITETMPAGWQFELLDASDAMATNPNAIDRTYEVLLASQFDQGDSTSFSYRLHPGGLGTALALSGSVSGRFHGEGLTLEICGELGTDP
jgi:hypothetical protein